MQLTISSLSLRTVFIREWNSLWKAWNPGKQQKSRFNHRFRYGCVLLYLLVTEDRHGFSSIWSKSLDFPGAPHLPRAWPCLTEKLEKITHGAAAWSNMTDEPSRLFSNRVSCCLSQSSYLINYLHLEGRAPIRPPPPPNTRGAFHSDKKSVKFGETQMGCVRLGNLDVDFKIQFRICNRTRNPKKDFNAEICVFTVRLRNPKKNLKNCP